MVIVTREEEVANEVADGIIVYNAPTAEVYVVVAVVVGNVLCGFKPGLICASRFIRTSVRDAAGILEAHEANR